MYPFLSAPSPIKKTWLTWFFSWLTWFEITEFDPKNVVDVV